MNPVTALYIHVPFCVRKCDYCAFYSEPARGDLMDRYVVCLLRELSLIEVRPPLKTLFMGGGTPTLLSLRHWEQLFQGLADLGLHQIPEFSVECNPATVSLEKARLLRQGGVNRVSMGIQSLETDLLERLGRVHSREEALKSYDILRQAGFENINLDLMFAIPGQTMAIWRKTISEIIPLQSEHLSSYEVTYEEDTPLFIQMKAGQFAVDEDLSADMYEELMQSAGGAGYHRYEISNWARNRSLSNAAVSSIPRVPDYACKHNITYWRGGQYHGAGPSAASHRHGVRSGNWADTTRYCQELEANRLPTEYIDELTPMARAGEIAAFGLRMACGWSFTEFKEATGFDLREQWAEAMQQLLKEELAVMDADHFRLNDRGLRFADHAALLFIQ